MISPNWPKDWAVFWVLISTVHLTVSSCQVTYTFQSESTLHNFLNVKKLLLGSMRKIWSLSDCNWTRTQNHLVCQRTLNHLAKVAEWLNYLFGTYLYSAFNCIFLSCHVRVSAWIHPPKLPQCQETPCSKQARNRKF